MLDLLNKEPPRLDRQKFSAALCDFVDASLVIEEENRASAAELLNHEFLAEVMLDKEDQHHVRTRQLIENLRYAHDSQENNNGAAQDDLYNIGTNDQDLEIMMDLIIERHLLGPTLNLGNSHPSSSLTNTQTIPGPPRLFRGSTVLDDKRLHVLADQFAMTEEEIQQKFRERQQIFLQKKAITTKTTNSNATTTSTTPTITTNHQK